MTPSDHAEPCLPALTREQWIAARDRMLDGSSDNSSFRHSIEAMLERAFGPCPARPFAFEWKTGGGSKVTISESPGGLVILAIDGSPARGTVDTRCSGADLNRIGYACIRAARDAA